MTSVTPEPNPDLVDLMAMLDAEAWKPEPGDTVSGTVADVTIVEGNFGQYPAVTIKTADGFVTVHASRTVLQNELGGVDVDDLVAVRCNGPVEKKNGTGSYESYSVRVRRQRPRVRPTVLVTDDPNPLGDVPAEDEQF